MTSLLSFLKLFEICTPVLAHKLSKVCYPRHLFSCTATLRLTAQRSAKRQIVNLKQPSNSASKMTGLTSCLFQDKKSNINIILCNMLFLREQITSLQKNNYNLRKFNNYNSYQILFQQSYNFKAPKRDVTINTNKYFYFITFIVFVTLNSQAGYRFSTCQLTSYHCQHCRYNCIANKTR